MSVGHLTIRRNPHPTKINLEVRQEATGSAEISISEIPYCLAKFFIVVVVVCFFTLHYCKR
jgi:hypothetical protein